MSVIKYRRDLHQIPEIAFKEYRTKDYILNILEELDCEIFEIESTGIIAYFNKGKENTLAFRADMDALYIREANEVDYRSKNHNLMHACGHDGHMAALLAFADYLNENDTANNVVLIFQPAEEIIQGANTIIKTGLLDELKVKAIFGFHIWPKLDKGKIYTKPGALMAKASEITIKVSGKAIHVANFKQGVDSLRIASELLNRIYEYEESLKEDFVHLLKFGRMESGTIRNIISAETVIEGTIRSFDQQVFAEMQDRIEALRKEVSEKYDTDISIHYSESSYPVINDKALLDSLDIDYQLLENPVLQAEDFGNYAEFYPAVFFFLGTGDSPSLHTENFDFDDSDLNQVLELYKNIVNKDVS